jgi:4-amino-4-deoxy-L-arabinose transferase-like glycosyltransferase
MPSLRGEWRYVAGLVAFFVVAAVAFGAGRDVPVIDDWTYAWSVEQLLEHGRLAVLDWSAVYPVGPALWGAGWSLAFGFSFGTLRVSSLALAIVASGALYFLLRELEASPRVALLGALTVAANPAFLLLASSFMTDVPFVAFTLLALLCYVRAINRDDPALLWWGGVWTCLSCLERQVGVLTPVAAMPLLVRAGGVRLTRAAAAAPIGATYAAMLAGSLALATWMPRTSEMELLSDRLSYLWMLSPRTYLTYNLYVFTTIAFYAFPALVAMAAARGLWRTRTLWLVIAGVAVAVAVVAGEWPSPIRDRNTWTMRELGGARQLLSGEWPDGPRPWPEPWLRVLGVLALALGVVAVWGRATLQRLAITPRTPILVYFAAYIGMVNVLWFYNDRYVLVLLPVLVVLALDHAGTAARPPRLSWVLAGIFAVVAVVGIRDTLRFNQAVRDTWQSLIDQGVPAADIDAGYAWTGWVLYAHPEHLAPGQTADDVPWVRSKRALPYRLAKAPMEGYVVVREVGWDDDARWPGPDRLYVLRQQPATGSN